MTKLWKNILTDKNSYGTDFPSQAPVRKSFPHIRAWDLLFLLKFCSERILSNPKKLGEPSELLFFTSEHSQIIKQHSIGLKSIFAHFCTTRVEICRFQDFDFSCKTLLFYQNFNHFHKNGLTNFLRIFLKLRILINAIQ